MSFLSKVDENKESYNDILSDITAPDGKTRVVMLSSHSELINKVDNVDIDYMNKINNVLVMLQDKGFSIVNVEHTAIKNNGSAEKAGTFHTLITYK